MLAGTRRGGQVSLPWGVSPGPRVPAVPPLVELLTPPVPLGGGAHLRQEDALHPAIPCSVLVVLSSVQAKPLLLLRPRVWQDQPRADDCQTACPTGTLSRAQAPSPWGGQLAGGSQEI